jgi:hypothetical protein
MLPWVILGIMLAIGLLISVIYTAVVFFIDGFILAGALWLLFGLLSVGEYYLLNDSDIEFNGNFFERLRKLFIPNKNNLVTFHRHTP